MHYFHVNNYILYCYNFYLLNYLCKNNPYDSQYFW